VAADLRLRPLGQVTYLKGEERRGEECIYITESCI
jgi:hypothetical protein